MTHLRLLTPALLMVAVALPVASGVQSVTGAVTVISPPVTVFQNTFESNSEIRLFSEKSLVLSTGVDIDISVPSTINSLEDFTPSTITSGQSVSSYYVHFDPVGISTSTSVSGSITFDEDIIGIIFRTGSLTPTHGQLGSPITTYQEVNNLGAYGADYGQDSLVLAADLRSVHFTFTADDGSDSIRILTALNSLYADFDGDGDVDGVDLAEMFANFNGPGGGVPANPATDLDGDSDVDGVDLATLFGQFTGPLAPASVPEPGSLVALVMGGLLVRRRWG